MENHQVSNKGNMSITYIIIAAIVVIGGIVWFSTRQGTIAPTTDKNVPADSNTMTNNDSNSASPAATTESTRMEDSIRIVNVTGSPFKFDPKEIRVRKGETVKIVFLSEKGNHDWVIDEFNARTKILTDGESDSIQFVADKAGTFEYYCSVGNHRAMGMKGNLIVE